eukprot:g43678.t1
METPSKQGLVVPIRLRKKLSQVKYLVKIPDRKKFYQVCHVNMLKPYYDRDRGPAKQPFMERSHGAFDRDLERLREAKPIIRLAETEFTKTEGMFFGHGRMAPKNVKTNAIKEFPRPSLKKEYFPRQEKLCYVLCGLQHVIDDDEYPTRAIPTPPLLTFKQPPNVHSKLPSLQDHNTTQPCHSNPCKTCQIIEMDTTIKPGKSTHQ